MPDYEREQEQMNREYKEAFRTAPKSFLARMERKGMKPEPMVESVAYGVIELNEGAQTVSYTTPTPEDTIFDQMVEKYGIKNGKMIEEIIEAIKEPMQQEMNRQKAQAIASVAGWLIKNEKGNLLARIHSLIHSIPRMAGTMGLRSMRDSARACGATVTWIKNGRDKWCDMLDLPIPVEGQKKPESKAKYKKAAEEKHWRKRRYQRPS